MAHFGIRGWKAQGPLAARDRVALLTSFGVAVTILVVARLLINWVTVPTAIWLAGVASLAGGVFGAVLRWPKLAWFSGTHPRWRAMGVGATLVSLISKANPRDQGQ